jgi:hypothetical protein
VYIEAPLRSARSGESDIQAVIGVIALTPVFGSFL